MAMIWLMQLTLFCVIFLKTARYSSELIFHLGEDIPLLLDYSCSCSRTRAHNNNTCISVESRATNQLSSHLFFLSCVRVVRSEFDTARTSFICRWEHTDRDH